MLSWPSSNFLDNVTPIHAVTAGRRGPSFISTSFHVKTRKEGTHDNGRNKATGNFKLRSVLSGVTFL